MRKILNYIIDIEDKLVYTNRRKIKVHSKKGRGSHAVIHGEKG